MSRSSIRRSLGREVPSSPAPDASPEAGIRPPPPNYPHTPPPPINRSFPPALPLPPRLRPRWEARAPRHPLDPPFPSLDRPADLFAWRRLRPLGVRQHASRDVPRLAPPAGQPRLPRPVLRPVPPLPPPRTAHH